MKFSRTALGAAFSALFWARSVLGQDAVYITEPNTNITFACQQFGDDEVPGGLTFGYVLPANAATVDATEYIGYIVSFQAKKKKHN
jgi:hypothetical protein